MDDKKIQARNKFVGKINGKIEKLTEDIRLLIEVDQALNVQTGGALLGDIAQAMKNIKTPSTTGQPSLNMSALDAAANALADELRGKITTLETTLRTLLTHISNHQSTVDLSSLNVPVPTTSIGPLSGVNTLLDANFEPRQLETFNRLLSRYTNDTPIIEATYLSDINSSGLTKDIKELLHNVIKSTRNTGSRSNKLTPDILARLT